MNNKVVVAGGGIGGLACALVLARAGTKVELVEQTAQMGDVGAGLQLGPNAVRVLASWGLSEGLRACAVQPEAVLARDSRMGHVLGRMRLGERCTSRYGQPYLSAHRADLHGLLLQAVQAEPNVSLHLGTRVAGYLAHTLSLDVVCENRSKFDAAALIGADGLWSQVRMQMLGEFPARGDDHVAYRALVEAEAVPVALRQQVVTTWLGPNLHVVHYPIRRGELFNLVAVVGSESGRLRGDPSGSDPNSWRQETSLAELKRALGPVCPDLTRMLDCAAHWTLWALNDRVPLSGPGEQARGRVALLGDAAHPMLPYLAQGAAMALEDAWTLGQLLQGSASKPDWPDLLARYAQVRWQRNARVQQRAQRNGRLFHASGPQRLARDVALAVAGERLMDNGWLYGGPPDPRERRS